MVEYINIEAMQQSIFELLKGELEKLDAEYKEFIDDEINDDFLQEHAFELTAEFNGDMKTYLHSDDKHIVGNFNNIEIDYCKHITGEYRYNEKLIQGLVSRLDSEDKSEQTKSDLDFLNAWFWETFGTFGITYNFSDMVGSMIYEWEQERETA